MSKATEKVVASRLTDHLEDNNLLEFFLVSIQEGTQYGDSSNNDLLRAIDDNACVIVVLLDLSAAFDTVDHQILLTRLKCRYGVKGKCPGLDAFTSLKLVPIGQSGE